MKILIAIISDKNSEALTDHTLKWAGRGGFNTRIFIPDKRQLSKYQKAVEEANYRYYLSLPYTIIEYGDPLKYAKKEGYDLLVKIPDNLAYWGDNEDPDRTVLDYSVEVGEQRVLFSKYDDRKFYKFKNGSSIQRVNL